MARDALTVVVFHLAHLNDQVGPLDESRLFGDKKDRLDLADRLNVVLVKRSAKSDA
jgi:hypothetical protein